MDHYRRSQLNAFVNDRVNRMAEHRTDHAWLDQAMHAKTTRFLPIWRSRCLINRGDGVQSPTLAAELDHQQASWMLQKAVDVIFLGFCANEGARFALNLPNDNTTIEDQAASFGQFEDLRTASRQLADPQAGLLAYAKALTDWQDKHRFCGVCGSPTRPKSAGHVLQCTGVDCGRQHFPRLDPAVIVSVTYEDALLMGRQSTWAEGQFSVVAGFVEAGESLEQAVAREVLEETGVVVSTVNYHSSQPWPFPNSIMLGFDAVALAPTIKPNDNELEQARWFTRQDIVDGLDKGTLRLPSAVSISLRLIEDWFDEDKTHGPLRQRMERAGNAQWRHAKEDGS